MTTVRQDAWTDDEDILLAEVVLRHIREGSTQLSAFEEVGKKLSRTPAACGFRWNSYVRKQYKSAIELAKQQRKNKQKSPELVIQQVPEAVKTEKDDARKRNDEDPPFSLEETKQILRKITDSIVHWQESVGVSDQLNERMLHLEEENLQLQQELEKMKKEYEMMEEEYRALVSVLEKARKMAST